MFEEINQRIRNECFHLRDEADPLQTILMTTSFELPLCYALCNILADGRTDASQIASSLFGKLDRQHLPPIPPPAAVPEAARGLTFDTVLHCAFHAVPLETKEGTFLKNIGLGWGSVFESIQTSEQLRKHVESVQKRHFPVVAGLSNLWNWNPFFELWRPIDTELWEDALILKLYLEVRPHLRRFEGFSGLSSELEASLSSQDWLAPSAKALLEDLKRTPVVGNPSPPSRAEFIAAYGRNVPEYYFFDRSECGNDGDHCC